MRVVAGAATLLAASGVVVFVVWSRGGFRDSPPSNPHGDDPFNLIASESLADRLDYEGDGPTGEETPLPDATAARLDDVEKVFAALRRHDRRLAALAQMHSSQVEEFVNQEDFGYWRTPPMATPEYLNLPDAPPVPFALVPALSPGGEGSRVDLPETAEAAALSLRGLGEFHDRGRYNFLDPSRFGLIRDREHVIAFRSHLMWRTPDLRDPSLPVPPAEERWALSRLELVSLLKQKSPAVYVSDHLPRMDDLKKAETRPLSPFEARALEAMRTGDDLAVEATSNRILLMGSLRATKQCLACHRVRRGDLLGAFSYELRRDPTGN